MDTPALPPCPFCGSSELFTLVNIDTESHVQCNNCGARGPAIDNKITVATHEAATAWSQRSAWQSIETAPRDGTQILAIWPGKGRPRIVWFDRARWTDDGDHSLIDFTHWQPLPSPPPVTP
jgi:hypothetical protein